MGKKWLWIFVLLVAAGAGAAAVILPRGFDQPKADGPAVAVDPNVRQAACQRRLAVIPTSS